MRYMATLREVLIFLRYFVAFAALYWVVWACAALLAPGNGEPPALLTTVMDWLDRLAGFVTGARSGQRTALRTIVLYSLIFAAAMTWRARERRRKSRANDAE
jgi:hypothetical protein